MHRQRPVNLNLFTIRFPITAIASILHRLSGAVLFLLLPLFLWLWDTSLRDSGGFASVASLLSHPFSKICLLGTVLPLCYHLVSGIRHLLMDLGKGMALKQARRSAIWVMVMAVLFTMLMGVWLW